MQPETLASSTSPICRKPRFTYKSPGPGDMVVFPPATLNSRRPTQSAQTTSSPPEIHRSQPNTRYKYPMAPSLPLYHPLGRLATSLPPLDPTLYGLPMSSNLDILDHRILGRSRRPTAKIQDVDDTAIPTVSTIAAVAAREVKERASPRKRRTGGAKRKRKDLDDGDATYPAKRTRVPRGATGQAVEEESPTEGGHGNDAPSVPEIPDDLTENAKRRLTRSRGNTKRRDSSASETTSILGSTNPTAVPVPEVDAGSPSDNLNPESHPKADETAKNNAREEGELSEDQTPG